MAIAVVLRTFTEKRTGKEKYGSSGLTVRSKILLSTACYTAYRSKYTGAYYMSSTPGNSLYDIDRKVTRVFRRAFGAEDAQTDEIRFRDTDV